MASKLIVPFDFNPSSAELKTASYTIPEGKYGKITFIEKKVVYSNIAATNASITKNYIDSELMLLIDSAPIYKFSIDASASITATSSTTRTLVMNFSPSYVGLMRVSIIKARGANDITTSNMGVNLLGVTFFSVSDPLQNSLVGSSGEGIFDQVFGTHRNNFSSAAVTSFRFIAKPLEANPISVWVKSGSVIQIPVGGAYYLEEYNEIS